MLDKTMIGSTTDSDGNYSINNIPLGKYLIRVEYLGFETQTKEIYISEKNISHPTRIFHLAFQIK